MEITVKGIEVSDKLLVNQALDTLIMILWWMMLETLQCMEFSITLQFGQSMSSSTSIF